MGEEVTTAATPEQGSDDFDVVGDQLARMRRIIEYARGACTDYLTGQEIALDKWGDPVDRKQIVDAVWEGMRTGQIPKILPAVRTRKAPHGMYILQGDLANERPSWFDALTGYSPKDNQWSFEMFDTPEQVATVAAGSGEAPPAAFYAEYYSFPSAPDHQREFVESRPQEFENALRAFEQNIPPAPQ